MFVLCFFFFFNDTATTEIYTLSLHDALPILNGIGDFQTNMTKTISYITLLIGLGIGFETLREILNY